MKCENEIGNTMAYAGLWLPLVVQKDAWMVEKQCKVWSLGCFGLLFEKCTKVRFLRMSEFQYANEF